MLQKKQVMLAGFFFFSLGMILLLSSANGITGFVVAEGLQVSTSFSGLLMTLLGSLLLVAGVRGEEEEKPKELEVLVSEAALERSSKDRFVRTHVRRYVAEIKKIKERLKANPSHTPQTEIIGEFHVSPQGHVELRVAWHYDNEKGVLYIDDFLYKKTEARYVDDWASRAAKKEITPRSYKGYQRMEEVFA